MNDDFWKEKYKPTWADSSKREKYFAEYIKNTTGYTATPFGLGAESSEFLHGSAFSNGYAKGDADLKIEDSNIYLEITGPLTNGVGRNSPLWFRPDKITNAIGNIANNHDTFLVHNCPRDNVWRTIHIDADFIRKFKDGHFAIVHPTLHGVPETYCEVLANDECIHSISFLIEYIMANGHHGKRKCPLCGADLLVRTARRGLHSGKHFLGCSNYPRCNFIENID